MEVSKLTLSDELLHQTSSLTKVLLWMEAHPKQCRNTNIRNMSKTISLDKDRPLKMTTFSIEQLFYQLMRRGLITRNGGRFKSDFVINYGHPEMPKELDGAQSTTTLGFSRNENVNKRNAEIVRKNGGTLRDIILNWMENNPDKIVDVKMGALSEQIAKETRVHAVPDSIIATIGRMVRGGQLKRIYGPNGNTFTISVAKTENSTADKNVPSSSINCEGTLEKHIIKWMVKNPDKLVSTSARTLVQGMFKSIDAKTTFESLYTQFRKMYKSKDIINRKRQDDGWYSFELNKAYVPKEEEKPSFKELVQDGMDPIHASILTEEKKENKMEEQTVNLPEGKTINLVININFGK